ncbi:MAG: PepSY domain-containing protein [Bacteroidetes bacterium]|nr:PepSY domain-containing protein [Bacteroidota bacterium]
MVYLNPYTGEIQGTVSMEEDFFGIVLKIHRSLYLGDVGKKITGISAIVFLVMLISGIILWWPKRIKRIKGKIVIALRANKSRRNYDLHSVLGFYASIFLLFVVLTGLIWSFKSVENSLYWVTGSKKEEKKIKSNYSGNKSTVSLQKILDAIQKGSIGDNSNYFISLPEDSVGVIKFRVQSSNESYLVKRSQYSFDQYEYKLLKIEQYDKASVADKIKMNLYNIHTGKILGLAGQIINFIASLIAASLPITGFMIWKRRNKPRKGAV